jgi:chemotaxis methyl-accepting protein methylase
VRDANAEKELQCLLEKIYRERGFDFREYKETTVTRRLRRRLRARAVLTYSDYGRVLDQDTCEYSKLFDDLTINVTSFFRDEVAFKALEEAVLPALIGEYNRDVDMRGCLRIWSAGCATGQEPYSLTMLLLEMLGQEIRSWDITIWATDIDDKALQRAQEGVFTAKDVEGIRPVWLNRYFVSEGNGFHVQSVLKELVAFQSHNLVSDPPYHDLDLVVCRNVLIYFTPALQTRVLGGFHEGLKEDGFLLLGKAEVPVGETRELFCCVDKKAKLYRKAEGKIVR